MMPGSVELRPHQFSIALMQPQIAPNTGNIGRLCVATGTRLHLVRPMGFVLSDRNLKRSAMDYWDRLQLRIHDDDAAFFAAVDRSRCWFFTSKSYASRLFSALLHPVYSAHSFHQFWIEAALVPGVACGKLQGVVILIGSVGPVMASQIVPQVFDWIQLW
jgi:hypothetical protein